MNNYLLESMDSLALSEEVDKIIKDKDFIDAEVFKYDLEEDELSLVLENLDTYGLLSTKKVIVIRNIQTLKYDNFKNEFEHLFKYLKNPSEDNLLLITESKLNNTSKVIKTLKSLCAYKLIDLDPKNYIKRELRGYEIDDKTINLLNEFCLGDISKISSECSKLKDYKYEEKKITSEDIYELVSKKLGDPKDLTFSFSRSLALRDRKEALGKYRELLSYDIDAISIIGLLASQIRIIYQVKLLEKGGLSNKEIADILEEKSDYRIRKTKELTRLYTEESLLEIMQQLAEIDLKIKTSDIDNNSLLENFILNI